jgi:hypothetical protein
VAGEVSGGSAREKQHFRQSPAAIVLASDEWVFARFVESRTIDDLGKT